MKSLKSIAIVAIVLASNALAFGASAKTHEDNQAGRCLPLISPPTCVSSQSIG